MKPIVIQTENLPQECSDWLAERCDLHICPADSLRFKELLPKAQGLAIRTYTSVDCAMLEAAPNLKVVGRAGVGVDNIDLQSCNERGVTVVHTPEANSESVVEFVLTTMLSQLRALHYVTSAISQKEWNALRDASVNQNEFSETTIGIIGFGRIGSRLGKMAKSMGFRVVFNDVLEIREKYECEQVQIQHLLTECDVISIHVDGRTENNHLCNTAMFSAMKPSVLFMNASRGFIVDAYALTDFLKHNSTAHAILDVHEPEPITNEYPLLHMPNATLYPHVACKTKKAMLNMGWVVKDIDAVLSGKDPQYQIT
jgi:phosphoglycerate dehydrogenase-like enzyme